MAESGGTARDRACRSRALLIQTTAIQRQRSGRCMSRGSGRGRLSWRMTPRRACLRARAGVVAFITSREGRWKRAGPHTLMSLLSSSEALSFNAFLASVDHAHDGDISPDLVEQISIAKGKHALAKATKDLMSLGNRAHPPTRSRTASSRGAGVSSAAAAGPSHWPSFSPDPNGGNARSPRSFDEQSKTTMMQHDHGAYLMHAHSQSPSLHSLTSGSSPYTLPPLNDGLPPAEFFDTPHRRPPISSPSAPAALDRATRSSSKRSVPDDVDSSSAKRTKQATPREKQRRQSSASTSSMSKVTKPALLTPAEKRANHIQSEQKRRANIRRGYDALCAAVPALREAIAQEEANGGADAESSMKGRKRRRKSEDAVLDGRAGPKSENVVLQKSTWP